MNKAKLSLFPFLVAIFALFASIAHADSILYYDLGDNYIKKLDLQTMQRSRIVKMSYVAKISSTSGNHLIYSYYEGNTTTIKQDTIKGVHTDWFTGDIPACSPKNNDLITYTTSNSIYLLRYKPVRQLTKIIKNVYRVHNISWSPDSTKIAYDYEATENSNEQLFAIYDLKSKKVTKFGPGEAPEWTPDGKSLIYANIKPRGDFRTSDIVVLNLSNRKKTLLIKGAYEARYLSNGKALLCIKKVPKDPRCGLYQYDLATKKCKLIDPDIASIAIYRE